jgi:hypothetical protein
LVGVIILYHLRLNTFFLVGLKFELRTFHLQKGTLPLEPHLQSILLWFLFYLFFCSGYFGDAVSGTICPGWPQTSILPVSAFQVARATGVSHWHWQLKLLTFVLCFVP